MLVVITYDIALTDADGQQRLRQIAKICEDYGTRVQYSVFECDIDSAQLVMLKDALLKVYQPEKDSIRIYYLGNKWRSKIEHYGAKHTIDIYQDDLIL